METMEAFVFYGLGILTAVCFNWFSWRRYWEGKYGRKMEDLKKDEQRNEKREPRRYEQRGD